MFGSSSNLISESNELIGSFENFYQLQSGNIGTLKIADFEENQSIVKGNYESNFMDWKGSDNIDLIVLFGVYDFETGENNFHLEDRFPIDIQSSFTETPTPTPEPDSDGPDTGVDETTPTPVADDGNVTTINAEGDVKLTEEAGRIAYSGSAFYEAENGNMTLSDSVEILDGNNQLRGDKAIINMETGYSKILAGSEDKRVTGKLILGTSN